MNIAMNTMNASAGNTIRNEMIAVHFKYVGMYPIVLPPGELGATVSMGCIGVFKVVGLFLTRHNGVSNDHIYNYCDLGRNETV